MKKYSLILLSAGMLFSFGVGCLPADREECPYTQANDEKKVQVLSVEIEEDSIPKGAKEELGPIPKGDLEKLVQGNNQFALDLYQRLAKAEGNLVFSPYSISSALAMTYAGARDETAEEMAKVLHFTLGQEGTHPAFAHLNQTLQANGKLDSLQLQLANSLWAQKGYPFREEFLEQTWKYYGSGLKKVDFASNPEAVRQAINAWVEKQTKNKILDLLKQGTVGNQSRLILANALYFQAEWEMPFSGSIKNDYFQVTAKKNASVMMMYYNNSRYLPYYEEMDFQLLELPYKGKQASLVVILPQNVEGLANLEKLVTPAKLREWLAKIKDQEVLVTLPKFSLHTELTLGNELAKMGMPLVFAPNADLSGISASKDLHLQEVIHQSVITVAEKGTEAVAATAGIFVEPSALSKNHPISFHADHPFLFIVQEHKTGSILFWGRLVNPKI